MFVALVEVIAFSYSSAKNYKNCVKAHENLATQAMCDASGCSWSGISHLAPASWVLRSYKLQPL